VTALAWLPLVIEGFRALGLAAAVREHAHLEQRLRGYPEAVCVETLRAFLGRFHEDAGERARGHTRRTSRPTRLGSRDWMRSTNNCCAPCLRG
jgi:hypothetical protein